MGGINPFIGASSLAERTHQQSLVFKALAKRIASTLRCGLPGVITAFNPSTQYASVQLAITENLIKASGGVEATAINQLDDVLVLLPGSTGYCLTFPDLVGCECYVCFADMCINAWATYGFKGTDANGHPIPQDQELWRRHDLSDGFAILAPRSQPNVIPNYSTTGVELRSMDGTRKIALMNDGTVLLKGTKLEIDGSAGVVNSGSTNSKFCIPVTINGTVWYLRLSNIP